MKKIQYLVLSFSLMISFMNFNVFANAEYEESQNSSGCKFTPKATEADEFINNDVEVEYLDDGSMIIRDYNNTYNADLTKKQPRGWIAIGIAIFSVVNGVLGVCSNVLYASGHDVCRIVLSYIGFGQNDGDYKYLVSGNYIPGYIPGCEPSHSLPCNSGYYEYRVEKS